MVEERFIYVSDICFSVFEPLIHHVCHIYFSDLDYKIIYESIFDSYTVNVTHNRK